MNRLTRIHELRKVFASDERFEVEENKNNKTRHIKQKDVETSKEEALILQKNWVAKDELYQHILQDWKDNKRDGIDEKWKDFVRIALLQFEEVEFMYNRLCKLIGMPKYRISEKAFFKTTFQEISVRIPDRQYEINMFKKTCDKFFQIMPKIEQRYEFDHKNITVNSKHVTGNVDWARTLRQSNYGTPLLFEMKTARKKFMLPENILLGYSIFKIRDTVKEFCQKKHLDEISIDQRSVFLGIFKKIQKTVDNFPYSDVLEKSQILSENDLDFEKIEPILEECDKRKNTEINNRAYSELFEWFKEFRGIHSSVTDSKSSIQSYRLEATKNLDAMFEEWLMIEIYVEIFNRSEIGKKPIPRFDETPKQFDFYINDNKLTFVHDKLVSGMFTSSRPDFQIYMNENRLAVFDAKNYSSKVGKADALHKIMAYMLNLKCHLGGGLFARDLGFERSSSDNEEVRFNNYVMTPLKEEFDKDEIKRLLDDILKEVTIITESKHV
jgi:hypothetical protein